MSKKLRRFLNCSSTTSETKIDIINNMNEKMSENDHLILLIGNLKKLFSLKKELEKNGINSIVVSKLTKNIIMKHIADVDVIVISFDSLEKTITILQESEVVNIFFTSIIVYSSINSSFSRKVSYLHGVDDYIPTSVDSYEKIIRIKRQMERKQLLNCLYDNRQY